MTISATRLITLILMLQRQPGQKAAELAQNLGVSVRTLHRYMEKLDEMGVPIYAEHGPHGGFSLVRGYKLPPLIFTPEEAVTLWLGTSLIREVWGQVYQEAATGALTKLENVLPDEQRQEVAWAQRSLVATGLNRIDIEMLTPRLKKLRQAVRERRRVCMLYQSAGNAQAEQRELDPYALVLRAGWWYVIGFCHLRQGLRYFRVDRIVEMALMDQTFESLQDFDLHAYMAREWQEMPQVKVRMRFDPQYVHLARASRGYWQAFEDQEDGSVVVTFQAPDVYSAASHALGYGPAVSVLEPQEVSQMVKEWAQKIAAIYTSDEEGTI